MVEREVALATLFGAAGLINMPTSIKIRFSRAIPILAVAGYWSLNMQTPFVSGLILENKMIDTQTVNLIERLADSLKFWLPDNIESLDHELIKEAWTFVEHVEQENSQTSKASDWDIGKCYADAFSKSKAEHSPNCHDALHRDAARRAVYELGYRHGSQVLPEEAGA